MKYLSEVTRIVTTFREPTVEIIDENSALSSEDSISKLYAGLKNGLITTDQKAAEVVYGKPVIDTKYSTLKNRLKRRLLNSLFFLNIKPPTFSEYASALYQSNKYLFLVKTLVALGGRNTAMKLAQTGLTHAQKYNITSNTIEFLVIIRGYSSFLGNEKNYDTYNAQFKHAQKTYEAECLAQEYQDRISLKFALTSAEQPEMIGIMKGYCDDLRDLRSTYDSKNLSYNYFRIQNLSYQISREYQQAVATCNEAEKYISEKPHLFNRNQLAEFSLQKLVCYLTLREYEKGKETAIRCEELYPKDSNPNWFIYMEYYFFLAMHTEHFSEAETIFNEITTHPRYSFQPEHKKEHWRLSNLYLQFVLNMNAAQESNSSNSIDLKKFLRNVPLYTKDKKGYNVAILILQILILLENNEFAEIINRMEALRTYRTRYLRAGSNKQSALFFRMLQLMETNSFSYEKTKQKSQKYFEKMKSIAADFSEIQDGLQVLPFDWMWMKILEMLKQKEEQKIIQKVMK
jgi:hypothetical protein